MYRCVRTLLSGGEKIPMRWSLWHNATLAVSLLPCRCFRSQCIMKHLGDPASTPSASSAPPRCSSSPVNRENCFDIDYIMVLNIIYFIISANPTCESSGAPLASVARVICNNKASIKVAVSAVPLVHRLQWRASSSLLIAFSIARGEGSLTPALISSSLFADRSLS